MPLRRAVPQLTGTFMGRIGQALLDRGRRRAPGFVLLLRFAVAGVLNTLFGYGVFALFVLAGLWPGAALVLATLAGMVFNYQTSRGLVFRSKGRLVRFVLLYTLVLVLNWASLRGLRWLGIPALEAQALLTFPLAALSFLGQRLFVFRPDAQPTPQQPTCRPRNGRTGR